MSRTTLIFGFGLAMALLVGWVAFPRAHSTRRNNSRSSFVTRRMRKSLASQNAASAMLCARTEPLQGFQPWKSALPAIPNGLEEQGRGNLGRQLYQTGTRDSMARLRSATSQRLVLARDPCEAAALACTECHSTYGESDQVRTYQLNRISGYSRDIWGRSISPAAARAARRHEDERLRGLPCSPQRQGGMPRVP